GYDAHHSRAVAAIFRRVVTGQYAELGDRVRIGIVDHAVAKQLVVGTTIQKVSNRIRTAPRHAEISAAPAEASRARVIRVVLGDARLQKSQTQHVASVQGQIGDGTAGNGLA